MEKTKVFGLSTQGLKIIPLIALGVIVGFGSYYASVMDSFRQTSAVQEGVRACFTRVTQSFTSYMIGDMGSAYLKSDFFKATGECYGDVIATVNGRLRNELGTVARSVNDLSNDIQWFHGRLEMKDRGAQSVISERYAKLETSRDAIIDEVDAINSRTLSRVGQIKWSFAVVIGVLGLVLAADLWGRRRRERMNQHLEHEAESQLGTDDTQGDVLVSAKVEDLMIRSLRQNQLMKCSTLFSRYHSEVLSGKLSAYMVKNASQEQYLTPTMVSLTRTDDTLEDDRSAVSAERLESVNLSAICNDVFDMLLDKIFVNGVVVDNHVDDDIFVRANAEALQQILFNAMSSAIDHSIKVGGGRRVGISTKVLGGSTIFRITDSGDVLTGNNLKALNADATTSSADLDVRLVLCKELMRDFSGKLTMKNRKNEQGELVGNTMELFFHGVEKSKTTTETKKLTSSIVKGSKREIADRINARTTDASN